MIILLISSSVMYVISLMLTDKLTLKYNRYTRSRNSLNYSTSHCPNLVLPSLQFRYIIDEINNPSLTVKTMGHQ